MAAERPVQRKFSFGWRSALVALALLLLLVGQQFWTNFMFVQRVPQLGPRTVALTLTPVALDAEGFGRLELAGAWRLGADDSRFGGFSSLAIDGGTLVALNDIGVVARFAPPGGRRTARVLLDELPGGPGGGGAKGDRDSEALLRDPQGRGWWVAFENKHQLWLYDRGFGKALQRVEFGVGRWPHNAGIEGIAVDGRDLLLFPENNASLVRVGGTARAMPVAGRRQVSEAATLPGGGILLVERRPTGLGFRNALVRLERSPRGYRVGARLPLGVGALDNVEALAVEPRPEGAVRLWLMTDDNFMRTQRTLLVALDAPAGTLP